MIYGCNDISLLILRTPNEEFIVVRIDFCPYFVNEFAKTGLTDGLANVQERRFPDFPTNANLKCYEAQPILWREGRNDEVERGFDDTVLEIRNAGGDVRRG